MTLAGVPGRISHSVLSGLRQRFSNGYVFRVPGAKLHVDRLARYDDGTVEAVVESARDAVFGTSKRPSSFCRNPTRPCALREGARHGCGLSADATCSLAKPDYCIVLYQEGRDEDVLLRKLHFSAYTSRLERAVYDRTDRTVVAVEAALAAARADLPRLRQEMESSSCPLLLPPDHFGVDDLRRTLDQALAPEARTGLLKAFRAERYRREALAYEGRKGLGFKPTLPDVRHGRAGPQDRADLALSHHFRLGCPYPDGFHYDVSRLDGRDMGGKIRFPCRIAGPTWPRGRNVNVLVDDCIRP